MDFALKQLLCFPPAV